MQGDKLVQVISIDPAKQGLKHPLDTQHVRLASQVISIDPAKQGLKPMTGPGSNDVETGHLDRSSKTRIETTQEQSHLRLPSQLAKGRSGVISIDPAKQGLKLDVGAHTRAGAMHAGHLDRSSKTRIETEAQRSPVQTT